MKYNLLASEHSQTAAGEVVKPAPGVFMAVLPGLTGVCCGVLGTLLLLRNGGFRHFLS